MNIQNKARTKLLFIIGYSVIQLIMGCADKEKPSPPVRYAPGSYLVRLADSGQTLDIPLDRFTIPVTNCLDFADDTLAFLRDSSILFIDVKKKMPVKSIRFLNKKDFGIDKIYNFSIKSSDSIFLVTNNPNYIYLLDQTGLIKDKFIAKNPQNSFYPAYAGSAGGAKMFFRQKKIYFNIASVVSDEEELMEVLEPESPTMTLDLTTRSLAKVPMTIGNKHNWDFGNEPYPSVAFDGTRLVYSFLSNHSVHAFDEGSTITADASSDFFQGFMEVMGNDGRRDFRKYLTKVLKGDEYALITYDPYRHVYYRFMYMGFIPAEKDNLKKLAYLRPQFSIIILDQNLKKIGETKMPYGRHVAFNHFVSKDGLYISNNHFLNKNANEETLSFSLYTLERANARQ